MHPTKQELRQNWLPKYIELGFSEALFDELLEFNIDFADLLHRCSNLKEYCNNQNANLFAEIKLLHLLALSGNANALQNYLSVDEQHINIQDDAQRTLIHYLAILGDPAVLKGFLTKHPECTLEKDRYGKGIKDYFNLSMNFETTESIESIIQSAMISAMPMLTERLFESNHYEQHAFDALMDLAAVQNVDAIKILEENADDFFERFIRLAKDDKDLDQHHSKLKRWATARSRLACAVKAATLWDEHWWGKTGEFRKNENKFLSMKVHHANYFAVRLAENKFEIAKKEGTSNACEEAFKHALAAAEKTAEGYFILGCCLREGYRTSDQSTPKQFTGEYAVCNAFAQNIKNKDNRFFNASIEALESIAEYVHGSANERTFAAVTLWQATGKIQYLKKAMDVNEDWVASHVNTGINSGQFNFKQSIEAEAFLLNAPATMSQSFIELIFASFEQLILNQIIACKKISEVTDILEMTLDKIADVPNTYRRLALHIIDDVENLSNIIRAATMIRIFNKIQLTETDKSILFKLYKTFPAALRNEIQHACPYMNWASSSALMSSSMLFQPAPSSSSSSSSSADGLSASMLPSAPSAVLEDSLRLPSVPAALPEDDKQKEQLSAQLTRK